MKTVPPTIPQNKLGVNATDRDTKRTEQKLLIAITGLLRNADVTALYSEDHHDVDIDLSDGTVYRIKIVRVN